MRKHAEKKRVLIQGLTQGRNGVVVRRSLGKTQRINRVAGRVTKSSAYLGRFPKKLERNSGVIREESIIIKGRKPAKKEGQMIGWGKEINNNLGGKHPRKPEKST